MASTSIVDSTTPEFQRVHSASLDTARNDGSVEVLWEDAEHVFARLRHEEKGHRYAFVAPVSRSEHHSLEDINRLAHQYEVTGQLDSAWALRPVELVRERGQTLLVVEYSGGRPLDQLIAWAHGDRSSSCQLPWH